jgi:hypothetical protein
MLKTRQVLSLEPTDPGRAAHDQKGYLRARERSYALIGRCSALNDGGREGGARTEPGLLLFRRLVPVTTDRTSRMPYCDTSMARVDPTPSHR